MKPYHRQNKKNRKAANKYQWRRIWSALILLCLIVAEIGTDSLHVYAEEVEEIQETIEENGETVFEETEEKTTDDNALEEAVEKEEESEDITTADEEEPAEDEETDVLETDEEAENTDRDADIEFNIPGNGRYMQFADGMKIIDHFNFDEIEEMVYEAEDEFPETISAYIYEIKAKDDAHLFTYEKTDLVKENIDVTWKLAEQYDADCDDECVVYYPVWDYEEYLIAEKNDEYEAACIIDEEFISELIREKFVPVIMLGVAEWNSGYIPIEEAPAPTVFRGSFTQSIPHADKYIPDISRYTPVKNQDLIKKDNKGTMACWVFATIGALELSLINRGLADNTIDLSEYHLLNFILGHDTSDISAQTDPLGGTFGDTSNYSAPVDKTNFLTRGGNIAFSTQGLANWVGAASEETAPYPDNLEDYGRELPKTLRYDDSVHLKDYYKINIATNRDVAKSFIKSNGAVVSAMYMTSSKYDSVHNSYYQNSKNSKETNHQIMLVGWDDDFPAANFATAPVGNGAWLVRNSYGGSGYEINGYFWLSYYDTSIPENGYVLIASEADDYDHNYQYDGTNISETSSVSMSSPTMTVANVFTLHGNDIGENGGEQIDAVGVRLHQNANSTATIDIYLNPEAGNPESGVKVEKAHTVKSMPYAGYYTVPLNSPIKAAEGTTFSVVVTYSSVENILLPVDCVYNSTSSYYVMNASAQPGQSYYCNSSKKWIDYSKNSNRNICIKAFTSDINRIDYVLDGGSNSPENEKFYKPGEEMALSEPVKTGFQFEGWYLDSDFTKPVSVIDDTAIGDEGLIRVYAKWKSKFRLYADCPTEDITWINFGDKFTLFEDGNGAFYSSTGEDVLMSGDIPAVKRDGYCFGGWFTETNGGGKKLAERVNVADSEAVAYYAYWINRKITYSLETADADWNFDINPLPAGWSQDGAVISRENCPEGTTLEYIPNPSREGYTFLGWYTGADGGGKKIADPSCLIEDPLTLYACWSKETEVFHVNAISPQEYTGSAIKPEVKVFFGNTELVKGTDYSVSYRNNIYVSSSTGKNAPTVIVTGRGKYADTVSLKFQIIKKKVNSAEITTSDAVANYTGRVIKLSPAVYYNGRKLINNTDYYLEYPDKNISEGGKAYKAYVADYAGGWTVRIVGKGGYSFTKEVKEYITRKTLLSTAQIKTTNWDYNFDAIDGYEYELYPVDNASNGEPTEFWSEFDSETQLHPLTVALKVGKKTIYARPWPYNTELVGDELNEYYYRIVSYQNNTSPGTATVKLEGLGKLYGTATAKFKISGISLSGAKITCGGDYTYTGEEICPSVSVSIRRKVDGTYQNITLIQNKDYTLSYSKNINAGKGVITIKGIGGYIGQNTRTFVIKPFNISAGNYPGKTVYNLTDCTSRISEGNPEGIPEMDYVGNKSLLPATELILAYSDAGVTETELRSSLGPDNKGDISAIAYVLENNNDFTLRYSDYSVGRDFASAGKRAKITISGKGNFTGSVVQYYIINPVGLTGVKIDVSDIACSNRAGKYKSIPTVTNANGEKLRLARDYVITGYYDAESGTLLGAGDKVSAGSLIRVEIEGRGSYAQSFGTNGTAGATYRVAGKLIRSASVKIPAQKYSRLGVELKDYTLDPLSGIKVKYGKTILTPYNGSVGDEPENGNYYRIVSYSNNDRIGYARVTIEGLGDFGGTKTILYRIKK